MLCTRCPEIRPWTVVCRDSCISLSIFIGWSLDVPERIKYKLGMLMYRCQHNHKLLGTWSTTARQFLIAVTANVYVLPAVMRSLPRYRLSTYGRRAFSVAGSTVWNSLPEDMWDPECSVDSYRQCWRHFYFRIIAYKCVQRIKWFLTRMRYINSHLTLTLTDSTSTLIHHADWLAHVNIITFLWVTWVKSPST